MSLSPRPAARLANALDIPQLTAFVQMRSLVLATNHDSIQELESLYGCTQEDAMRYFLHVHEWESETADLINDEAAHASQKKDAIVSLLRATLTLPLIRPKPEA